jgi:vacuolar-type H+-ATPase catalytic subunit A/Vma1
MPTSWQVYENELMRDHKIMVPPGVFGEVVKIYHGGTDNHEEYSIHEPLVQVRVCVERGGGEERETRSVAFNPRRGSVWSDPE